MKIQCIMKYVHMEIYVYYVIWLHADTHALSSIVAWRYALFMYYIYMKISSGCAKEMSSMKWMSSSILNLIKTSTVQCHRSHRCHCITQYRSSWPSGMDQWLTFTMDSKRLLDMLLKVCDFVSSFEVRSVASWACSNLGAKRRWCCILHWSIPPSPSLTSTLTLTLTLTPTEIGTPFSSPVSLSGRVPL